MSNYPQIPSESVNNLSKEILTLMPRELIYDLRAFVFEKNDKETKIATVNPDNPSLKRFAKERFGKNVSFFRTTENEIKNVLANYSYDFKTEVSNLAATAQATNDNVSRIIDNIIKYAFKEKASDIHIEPLRNETTVRFRVDGALHTLLHLPRDIHQAFLARIKILANMKIDEYRRPQDGRIEPEDFPEASIRVSTIPTIFGEKAALRLLNDSGKKISIDELGFSQKQKALIMENIEKPCGMIITSGPTGSGKTTTLYALLQLISKEGINISTLEDPVEYVLPGLNQIQINTATGITFPSGLRALLRQDPDVIMVGEIRDSETAIMTANAAMTGHLVFTTIHTNDAPSAFTRFLEMKVEDFVISSTVNLVIAQRLVRRICESCAVMEKLDPIILKKVKEREDVMAIINSKHNISLANLEKQSFRVGKGCKACLDTGYAGRLGIFELLKPNKEVHDLILVHASSEKIKLAAEKTNFKTMIEDGIDKVFNGLTTFEEVLRTTRNS
ncbi:MAG: GspE/PulE family protein [bacterium]